MTFKDFEYQRITLAQIEAFYQEKLPLLKEAADTATFMQLFNEINQYRGHVMTMATLCSIRHSIDTADQFYDQENDYWDALLPNVQVYETEFMAVCLDTPLKEELPIPATFFKLAENARRAFSPAIVADLQEENRLSSEYDKLKASAKIVYDGVTYNLASIAPKLMDPSRQVRKEAFGAVCTFYAENEERFDELYDQLVKVRDRIAKKLGFKSFTELGYVRMNRLDYDQDMVAQYRKEILKTIVPLVDEINAQQAARIGVDKLACYDLSYQFKTGNPTPKGDVDELVAAALKMYTEMSDVTGSFFKEMVDKQLFDLPTRPNKQMGGYCTDLFDYKLPFVFSNFNNTAGDVDVLTHETGHALQSYLTLKTVDIPDVAFPTYESCEIHSMSMEFFAHPWMELFFGEDKDKYIYYHITSALTFLPYGVLVDHFQHEVYDHPEMSKEQRKATWRKLEKMYKPYADYEEFPILEKGAYFYRQGHIFASPFYYIDYTLAQVCALQFYVRMLKKDEKAFADYLQLCRLGGTQSFLELVKTAGLKSPFEEGCLNEVAATMMEQLSSIDARNF